MENTHYRIFLVTSFFKVSGIVLGRIHLSNLLTGHLNSQYSLSGAMVLPFRYDEEVTININGGRIAPGLLVFS
jgi:hypothetical protein